MGHPHRNKGSPDRGDEQKPWDLKDEFKYAPKRPEDDPWKTLFDTLMEKEKKRCDVWRNEIENLLLFAGLFSGLVTAFILQSYKTLQPDPNADIVSLLQVIAIGATDGNTSNSNGVDQPTRFPLPPLPSSSFSASDAAVRVNICWFISLILSLTVVLSGIIAMQWLREHQSFTGHLSSSRDMLAILNMRIEALEHWHVHEIITTFPVVLAAALVLFFAGMIQFLHILGNGTLLIAVASIITISLVLLSLSTVLPTAQCVAMYIWPLRQDPPPSPCPYKSPQSGIFHAICYYVSRFLVRRHRYFAAVGSGIRSLSKLNRENKHALMYLTDTWSKKTWAEIDLCWLSVRQACVLPESHGYHRFVIDHNLPPLLDISKTFRDIVEGAKVSPDVLTAAYHCFHDLATPFVPGNNPHRKVIVKREELDETFKMIVKRNQFLQSLLHRSPSSPSPSPSPSPPSSSSLDQASGPHESLHGSHIEFEFVDMRKQFFTNISILHHQNLFAFTDRLKNYHYSKEFFHHRLELGLRLGNALFGRAHHTKHAHHRSFPAYLKGELFDQHRWKILKNDVPTQVVQQYALVLTTFFDNAAHPDHLISDECLLAHKDTADFLEKAAWDMFRIVTEQSLAKYSKEDRDKVVSIFGQVLERISTVFNETMIGTGPATDAVATEKGMVNGNTDKRRPPAHPVQFLFLAAIYVRRLNSYRINHQVDNFMDPSAVVALDDAMNAMLNYKRHILDAKPGKDVPESPQTTDSNEVKHRLDGKDRFGGVERFSEKWWTFLEGDHDSNCEDSVGSLYSNPTHTRPTKASITSTLTRLTRPVSSIIRFGAPPMRPSVSAGTQGTLPKYSEKSDDFVFPQTESPTAGSSRNPVLNFNVDAKFNVSKEQGLEGIPMVSVSTSSNSKVIDGLPPPDLRRTVSDFSPTPTPTLTTGMGGGRFRSIRSLSFSFSKPEDATRNSDKPGGGSDEGRVGPPSFSSHSQTSPPVRCPDVAHHLDPNCVMSDDPYFVDLEKY